MATESLNFPRQTSKSCILEAASGVRVKLRITMPGNYDMSMNQLSYLWQCVLRSTERDMEAASASALVFNRQNRASALYVTVSAFLHCRASSNPSTPIIGILLVGEYGVACLAR